MNRNHDFFQTLKISIASFIKAHAEFGGLAEGAKLLLSFGFQFSELMFADMSAMLRVRSQLRDGNSDRIDEATKHLKEMIFRLRASQENFLTSPRTLASLDERVSMIGVASLNREFDEYRKLARGNENMESLRAKFLVLASKIEDFEADDKKTAQERVKQILTPRPPIARNKKTARQVARSERDKEIRNQRKTTNVSKKQKQNAGR